jgi:hypothetical protein
LAVEFAAVSIAVFGLVGCTPMCRSVQNISLSVVSSKLQAPLVLFRGIFGWPWLVHWCVRPMRADFTTMSPCFRGAVVTPLCSIVVSHWLVRIGCFGAGLWMYSFRLQCCIKNCCSTCQPLLLVALVECKFVASRHACDQSCVCTQLRRQRRTLSVDVSFRIGGFAWSSA